MRFIVVFPLMILIGSLAFGSLSSEIIQSGEKDVQKIHVSARDAIKVEHLKEPQAFHRFVIGSAYIFFALTIVLLTGFCVIGYVYFGRQARV